MNPRLKKLIIIANIVVYAVVCLGIYAKRKGGFKKVFFRKKMSLEDTIAQAKKERVPALPAEKKVTPVPVTPAPANPVSPEISRAELPAHVRDAITLLENMRVKEQTMKSDYRALKRDPFVSLVGIEGYLSQSKFTADEYADLPPGLPTKAKQKSSPFTLFGTIKSRNGESMAIINGQVLQEGDIIDGYKVTKIEKKSVTLVSGKKVINLEIINNGALSETKDLKKLEEMEQ